MSVLSVAAVAAALSVAEVAVALVVAPLPAILHSTTGSGRCELL